METRPDADPDWRCPHGQACFHFDAALRKDIVDDICRRYGLEFKYRYEEVPRPMMFDPALPVWREGRDSSIKRLVDLLVRAAVTEWHVGFTLRTRVWRRTDGLRTRSARTSRALHGRPSASLGLKTSWSGLAVPQSSGMTRCEWCLHGWQTSCHEVAGRGYQGVIRTTPCGTFSRTWAPCTLHRSCFE